MGFLNKRLWFIPESPVLKAFWGVFALGIISRAYSFLVLPESAYTDALYHLMLARDMAAQQAIALGNWILPPPLFHSLAASLSILAGLALEFPFARAIPIALSAAFLLSCYLLFRKMFGKENFIIPLSFAAIFPWLVRYGTVNYTENLSLALLVFSLYALLRFRETMRAEWLALLAFAIPAFALTKLNAALIAPILFALVLVSAFRKKLPLKWVAFFAVVSIALSAFWFVSTHERFGYWSELDAPPVGISGSAPNPSGPITVHSLFLSHLSLYDFPPVEWFNRAMLPGTGWILFFWQALFFLLTIPITLTAIAGIYSSLRGFHGRKLHGMLLLALLALLALGLYYNVEGVFYTRYFIVAVPILAIFFARGVLELKRASLKTILACAFVIFAFYSLFLSGASALQYSLDFRQSEGMIEFVSSLPQGSKAFSEESGRAIGFYSGRDFGWDASVYALPAEEAIQKIRSEGFTHIAVSCRKPAFPQGLLDSLESSGLVKRVYNDSCSRVYGVE